MKKTLFSLLALAMFSAAPAHAQVLRYVAEWQNVSDPQITNSSTCIRDEFNYVATTVHRPGGTSYINVTCFAGDGTKIWNRLYDNPGIQNSFAGKIIAAQDGLALVGSVGAYNGDNEVILMMLDYNSGGIMDQVKYTPAAIGASVTYGFDVVYDASDNTFVLAGTGAYAPSPAITNPRFAWVMKVDASVGNIRHVYWDQYFEVIPGNSWYDGFNNIELVNGPAGVQYHLSGSASVPLPGGVQRTIVNNVMVNQDGTVAWTAPFMNYNTIPQHNLWGCDALYKSNTNEIILMYYSQDANHTVFVPFDATTGTATGIERRVAPFSYGITGNMPYNMAWTDPVAQDKVTFSGFNAMRGETFMCSADPITGAPDWMYTYPGSFDFFDLAALNYDLVTSPMTGWDEKVFFAPNAMSVDYNNNINYLSSITNNTGQNFRHLAIKTIGDGTLPSGCEMGIGWDAPTGSAINPMASTYAHLDMHSSELILAEHDVDDVFNTYCGPSKTGHTTGIKAQTKTKDGLKLYPNPAADACTIEWVSTVVTHITVSDVTGRLMQQVNAPAGDKLTLDTQNWSKGTYHVTVNTAQGTQHLSFVKL